VTTAPSATVIRTADEAIGAARRYAESTADGTIERDRAGRVPAAELAALDASGLLAITVPASRAGALTARWIGVSALDDSGWLVLALVERDVPAEAARGSLAVAQAKAFASEVAVEVAGDLFSLSGASAADERYDLSRHWRNARTHASHDPVAWKYHHIGNFLLNDVLPPNHGQI